MKKFLKENSLSIALFGLFFIFLIGLSITGYLHENEQLSDHRQPSISYSSYVVSGPFMEAVFENWESEFLQMGALVILTIWLVQKGSADSKKLQGDNEVDTSSRYAIIAAATWRKRAMGIKKALYANSLSIALFALFFVSFLLHAWSGVTTANQEALQHGQEQLGIWQYLVSAQFWFESFQNWQSEFLSVGVLIVLSIYLRQRGSPESKAIGEPNGKTGS